MAKAYVGDVLIAESDETVIVEGTPEVVEKEVTTVVEKVVTAVPEAPTTLVLCSWFHGQDVPSEGDNWIQSEIEGAFNVIHSVTGRID